MLEKIRYLAYCLLDIFHPNLVTLCLISWPTLFFFEVACSLIVLDCTPRKIQQNIKVGGAKLQRTVQYISADIRYTARATYSTVLSTFDICTNLL